MESLDDFPEDQPVGGEELEDIGKSLDDDQSGLEVLGGEEMADLQESDFGNGETTVDLPLSDDAHGEGLHLEE